MTELLFLLLPVAAGYGWIMGKNSKKHSELVQKQALSEQYSRGLKFLLDREEDKALEHLIKVLEVTANSVEHYLALASLFRKRGEIDKAIHIHELLLEQPTLADADKDHIMFELATDYSKAGLFSQAEQQLLPLLKSESWHSEALQLLLQLYQQTKEWPKALALISKLDKLPSERKLAVTVANFYCQAILATSDGKEHQQALYDALQISGDTIRPLFILAERAEAHQQWADVIDLLQKAIERQPLVVSMLLNRLEHAYQQLDDVTSFWSYIEQLQYQHANVALVLRWVNCVASRDRDQAEQYLTNQLTKRPNIRGFQRLLQLYAETAEGVNAQHFQDIIALVSQYSASKPEYQCRSCGFAARKHYWQCPSCKQWESVLPATGLDGY